MRLAALLVCVACAPAPPTSAPTASEPDPEPATCNGSAALCDRRFDEVALAFAHNAMSNADDGWLAPNQHHGLQQQLDDGIRGFMLDTHYWDDAHPGVYLCHASCALGAIPAEEGFGILAAFLETHPGDVIALVIEAAVTPEDTEAALSASGLLAFARAQPLDAPWPTLRELGDSGERALIFTESDGGAYPWYLDAYAYAWDTDYHVESVDAFACDVLRGDRSNPLFLMNHFLTAPIASDDLAALANPEAVLAPRIDQCEAETGDFVNWVAVDFYDVGDVVAVIAAQNGL